MRPNKPGQVAKFHTPLPDENPSRLYVVLDIIELDTRPGADIKALDTGLSFPPINTVSLYDLEVVEVETADIIRHKVSINKADYLQITGKVIKVSIQKITPDLTKLVKGLETSVWLTIKDENQIEHNRTLFVN